LEVHPTGIAYNIETAQQALAALDNRPEFGFNFDPSHLVWQLIDPVIFVKTFGPRIFHCHADEELLGTKCSARGDPRHRTGPTGFPFGFRPDSGLAAGVVPGSVGYDYVLSFEHEDPVMSPEDGAEKAIAYLRPLVIKKPLARVWW
jgi:sugar phosphate isomerase/epimerase